MTKSQENALKNAQNYPSYKKHWMKNKNLVIQCKTDYKNKDLEYLLIIGVRGGKTMMQKFGADWKVV